MLPRLATFVYCALLLSISAYLTIRGGELLGLGGSPYYLASGIGLAAVAVLLILKSAWSAKLYAIITGITAVWALYESGLDFLAMLPRLASWLVVGLWFFSPWYRADMGKTRQEDAGVQWIGIASLIGLGTMALGLIPTDRVVKRDWTPVAEEASVTDWQHYANSPGGQRFSEVAQITADNVTELEEVWRVQTGVKYAFKVTPLQVGDNVYVCTAGNFVIAFDAATGEEKWRFNPMNRITGWTEERLARGNWFTRTCRGVGYFDRGPMPTLALEGATEETASCQQRIITATTDARLFAVDAQTGERCEGFGENGEVDLTDGLGPVSLFEYAHTGTPLIAGSRIVVGGWVSDNQELGNASGVLRAFDAITGEFEWAFDIGRLDMQSMPPEDGFFTRGTPNVWTLMAYDPLLDLVYAPTGNAGPDYYGPKRRPFDEALSASVIAIHGATGEMAWSYQTVHHDIWDYDVPSQPTLVDIQKDGEDIPALLQPTKRGEVFVLDRRDGTPVWPATTCPDGSDALEGGECPVPQGAAPGDYVTPTQPFSGLPNFRPFRHEKDMWGVTPLDQLYCRIEYKKMRYEGHFTPPMPGEGVLGASPTKGGTFQFPGNSGGFNWPSVAVDADRGILIAQPMIVGNRIFMGTAAQRAELMAMRNPQPDDHDAAASPEKEAAAAKAVAARQAFLAQRAALAGQEPFAADAPRYGITSRFMSQWKLPLFGTPSNIPCTEPPYGQMAAIDLNTNEILWQRPIGNLRELGPFGIKPNLPMFEVGTPVLGGATVTRGNLIFQTGTIDSTFRAIDVRNGKTLWQQKLPNTSNATPITYMKDGRQYVVIAVPDTVGETQEADGGGGWLIAYALPQ